MESPANQQPRDSIPGLEHSHKDAHTDYVQSPLLSSGKSVWTDTYTKWSTAVSILKYISIEIMNQPNMETCLYFF